MMKIDKTFLLSSGELTIQQFGQLANELEKQELDYGAQCIVSKGSTVGVHRNGYCGPHLKGYSGSPFNAPDGVAPPQVYGQLLAIYLLQNDLPNAKYLWKRIPSNIKEENPEIVKLWSVGQNLWQCISNVYGLLNEEWPEYLKPIINAITDTTRRRAFTLISKAYTSISVEKVSAFLGMPTEDCIEVLSSLGWEVDTACKIMKPKNNDNKQEETIMSEEQLAKLTDLVSFLEN